jgi:hypothetical protein
MKYYILVPYSIFLSNIEAHIHDHDSFNQFEKINIFTKTSIDSKIKYNIRIYKDRRGAAARARQVLCNAAHGFRSGNGQINVGCTSDVVWDCFGFAFPLEQSVFDSLFCSIIFSVCMQLIFRCCALDDRSGCSSINLLFNNWFGDEFKGLCNLTVNFQGFALILVVSAFESVIMSKCCWVGLLLCACSVFSALRWNSVTSLV